MWQGSGIAAAEGPHLYLIDGWWYLLLAEGGNERGHSVSVGWSRAIRDPFEPHPTNPIFSQRSMVTHPSQSVGHADLVQTTTGS